MIWKVVKDFVYSNERNIEKLSFFFGRNAVKNEIDLYILFEQSWVGIENINDDYYNGESIWKNDNSTRLGI